MNDAKDIFGDEPDTDEISEAPELDEQSSSFDAVLNLPGGPVVVEHKTTDTRPASPKQKNYIYSLLQKKQIDGDPRDIESKVEDLSLRDASHLIDDLTRLPDRRVEEKKRPDDMPSESEVPAGHYAIENEDGELRFYTVWRATKYDKPWFVKVYVQHGGDESELPFPTAKTIVKRIRATGAMQAAQRYGKEIRRCCICNIRLTNRTSRELGIGPICGGRAFGEEFVSMRETVREQLIAEGHDPDEEIDDQ